MALNSKTRVEKANLKGYVLVISMLFVFFNLFAMKGEQIQKNIVFNVDTNSYNSVSNSFFFKGERYLWFEFNKTDEDIEIRVLSDKLNAKNIILMPSAEFSQIDSPAFLNNEYYSFHIRFRNIARSNFLSLRFKVYEDSVNYQIEEVKLMPVNKTYVNLYTNDYDLFIGEEKIFELQCNMPENLRLSEEWVITPEMDYKIYKKNNQLLLSIVPKSLGKKNFSATIPTFKPIDLGIKSLNYECVIKPITFTVKSGRLAFLNLDQKEITFNDLSRKEGIEVQIDKNRDMQIGKTYRIEEQETPGGALIAEIYTRQLLNNDKILCRLRVYNLHKPSDGYLYIKDGDIAKFITNFIISPQTSIQKISVLKNGVDWNESNIVFPGEDITIRLEGIGFHKAKFLFEEIKDLRQDTVVKTDNAVEYRLKIPADISKKKIFIYNDNENTGRFLQVKEYQEPRRMDFILVDYGNGPKAVEQYAGPELYEKTIKNIIISFDPDKIDSINKFYGKQYVDISVKITGSKNELLELTTLPQMVICPGPKSARNIYYDKRDATNDVYSLNTLLGQKTYDLDEWAKIKITFRHSKEKYNSPGLERNVEIILQRKIKFDIDVSFPSLLTKVVKDNNWQNGLGVSMAMIAQFSFYQKDKIARLMPYKVGVGFLALNAFNFSENITRDLGIVILGSVYPTRRDTKFSFPLYAGGGYLLNRKSWFWLFGPGIRVSF